MQLLVNRVQTAGLVLGILAGLAFFVWQPEVIALFTSHASVAAELQGPIWLVLACSQPLNGLVRAAACWAARAARRCWAS